MVQLSNFDASTIDPQQEFKPIPTGDYLAFLESSEKKTSSTGNDYLSLVFQLADGEFKGRKIFGNMNLWHPTESVSARSQAELSALCRAVGVLQPGDTQELANIPFTLKIGIEKRSDNGGFKNKPLAYKPKDALSQQASDYSGGVGDGMSSPPWQQ